MFIVLLQTFSEFSFAFLVLPHFRQGNTQVEMSVRIVVRVEPEACSQRILGFSEAALCLQRKPKAKMRFTIFGIKCYCALKLLLRFQKTILIVECQCQPA